MKKGIFQIVAAALCATAFIAEADELRSIPPNGVQETPRSEGRVQQGPSYGSEGDMDTTVPTEVQWTTNFQDALAKAKQTRKPLFVYFTGSDWCGWCKKMDAEIFTTKDFAMKTGNRMIFVLVDKPMSRQLPAELAQQNEGLRQKFGIKGYPTVILLDPDGNFIAETGYRQGGGSTYADYIIGLLS